MNKKTTGNQLDNDISSATDNGKNAQEKRFILTHRNESPTELALQAARYPDFDMPFVINQIEGGKQHARNCRRGRQSTTSSIRHTCL